ncbi:hypothetical protein ACFL35_21075, partial [Candidatus Riflebacteria bacterium]
LMKYTLNAPAGVPRPSGGALHWYQLKKGTPMFEGEYVALRGTAAQKKFTVTYPSTRPMLNFTSVASGRAGRSSTNNAEVAPHALPQTGYAPYRNMSSFVFPLAIGAHYFPPSSANQMWDPDFYNNNHQLKIGEFKFKYFFRKYEKGALDGKKILGFNARDTYQVINRPVFALIMDNQPPEITMNPGKSRDVRFPDLLLSGDYIADGFGLKADGSLKKKGADNNQFVFPIFDANKYSWIGATITSKTNLREIAALEDYSEGVRMYMEYLDHTPPGDPRWVPYKQVPWRQKKFAKGLYLRSEGYIVKRKNGFYSGENKDNFRLKLHDEFMPGQTPRFAPTKNKNQRPRQINATFDTDKIRVYVEADDGFGNKRNTKYDYGTDPERFAVIPIVDNDAPSISVEFITEDRIFTGKVTEEVRDPYKALKKGGSIAQNTAYWSFEKGKTISKEYKIDGHISTPVALNDGNPDYHFKKPELPENIKIQVAPGGTLIIGVNAFDNFWWTEGTTTLNGAEVTFNVKGTLKIADKKTGVAYLKKDYVFGPKTDREAKEEALQIKGQFPSKTVGENERLVTCYASRPPQEWSGVAPVPPGWYTLSWKTEDTSGNIQSLSFDFEVRPILSERYLLQNRR